MGKFGKKNHVKLDPLAYSICLLGESKVGKTTLIKKVCEKLAGEDGYLFLECDKEHGADAIEGIIYEDVIQWDVPDRDKDENGNEIIEGVGYEEVIDDIVENKTTDYKNLKVVVIDTYDQLITLAENEAIRLWNKKNPDKQASSLNEAWSGFGRGEKKAISLMFDSFERLRRVGVQTIILGHVKTKDVSDVASGESYQVLTSDQQQNYFNALKKNLHFLGLAYIDRTIQKEKIGVNKITKQTEFKKVVKDEVRKIKFRDDNYAIDSGSRFADIVSEIPMDADAFIEALTDAIKKEQEKSGISLEKAQEVQEKEEKDREKIIKQREDKNRQKKELEETIKSIKSFMLEHQRDTSFISKCTKALKEKGYPSFAEIDDVGVAKELLKEIKGLI